MALINMKPHTQLACAATIALISGGGGYWLGKTQSSVTPVARDGAGLSPAATAVRKEPPALDPADLRIRLDAEKDPLARFKLAQQHLEAWVDRNPAGALNWLASQPTSRRRNEVIRMALKQFSETDARGAAEWAMKNLSGGDLNNNLIAIANQWADQNGREAASWFLKLPATRVRDAALENMFFAWASNEPAAALDFIGANSDIGDLSPTLRRAALAGWAKSDPAAAVSASLTTARRLNDPTQFANTLANWGTMDLDASSQWLLAKVPAGETRTAAASELAVIFAQQAPAAGVAWLEKLAGGERNAAASTLAAEWARAGPAEAAKWAITQQSSVLTAEAVGEISRNFLRKDPAAFQAWREALPPGPMKDAADLVGSGQEEE
jgi:hypothetical protein